LVTILLTHSNGKIAQYSMLMSFALVYDSHAQYSDRSPSIINEKSGFVEAAKEQFIHVKLL